MSLREDPDSVTYEKRPTHLKNKEGRIFIATDALIARGDLVAVEMPVKQEEEKVFQLSKANKQQIIDKVNEEFDVELSLDDTLKVLRKTFTELKAKQDASDSSDSSAG